MAYGCFEDDDNNDNVKDLITRQIEKVVLVRDGVPNQFYDDDDNKKFSVH